MSSSLFYQQQTHPDSLPTVAQQRQVIESYEITLTLDLCTLSEGHALPRHIPLSAIFSSKVVVGSNNLTIVFGRGADCDVVFPNDALTSLFSRKHFELSFCVITGMLTLRDCGSLNGTFHNGVRLNNNNSVVIEDGDRIAFGYPQAEVVRYIVEIITAPPSSKVNSNNNNNKMLVARSQPDVVVVAGVANEVEEEKEKEKEKELSVARLPPVHTNKDLFDTPVSGVEVVVEAKTTSDEEKENNNGERSLFRTQFGDGASPYALEPISPPVLDDDDDDVDEIGLPPPPPASTAAKFELSPQDVARVLCFSSATVTPVSGNSNPNDNNNNNNTAAVVVLSQEEEPQQPIDDSPFDFLQPLKKRGRDEGEDEDDEDDEGSADFLLDDDAVAISLPMPELTPGVLSVLKPHQVEAVKFLWSRLVQISSSSATTTTTNTTTMHGAVLAHAMGTGKTLSVLTFLHLAMTISAKMPTTRALIICPKSVMCTWREEVSNWSQWLSKEFHSNNIDFVFMDSNTVFDSSLKGGRVSKSEFVETIWNNNNNNNGVALVMSHNTFAAIYQREVVAQKASAAAASYSSSLQQEQEHRDEPCDLFGFPLNNNNKKTTSKPKRQQRNNAAADDDELDFAAQSRRILVASQLVEDDDDEENNNNINKRTKTSAVNNNKKSLSSSSDPLTFSVISQLAQYCFIDEGHKITSRTCRLFSAVSSLTTKNRVVLTGTPMHSRNQLDAMLAATLCSGNNNKKNSINDGLAECVSIQSAQVLIDALPPLQEFVIHVVPSEFQRHLYSGCMSTVFSPGAEQQQQEAKVLCLSSLVGRLCAHTDLLLDHFLSLGVQKGSYKTRQGKKHVPWVAPLFDDTYHRLNLEHNPKMVLLLNALKASLLHKRKCVVFSQWPGCLDIVEKLLGMTPVPGGGGSSNTTTTTTINPTLKSGVHFMRWDGSAASASLLRTTLLRMFNEPTSPLRILLLPTRTGSLGLNITGASDVFLYDATWNPDLDRQAIFRVFRYGQRQSVNVFRFVGAHTLEETMLVRTYGGGGGGGTDEKQQQQHHALGSFEEVLRGLRPRDIPAPTMTTKVNTSQQQQQQQQGLATTHMRYQRSGANNNNNTQQKHQQQQQQQPKWLSSLPQHDVLLFLHKKKDLIENVEMVNYALS
eukprot:PhM_4_TR18820/c6_g1_i1/m.95846